MTDTVNPMVRAHRIHEHASSLGFDWDDVTGVLEKVREETTEIEEAIASGDLAHARRELGDLLFTVINLSRFVSGDASLELTAACDRFETRFLRVQAEMKRRGKRMQDHSLAELDVVWEEVKKNARS